jgi:hypothetical protein
MATGAAPINLPLECLRLNPPPGAGPPYCLRDNPCVTLGPMSRTKNPKPSLSEIHRQTKLSLAHISKVFSGTRMPSLHAAALIARARGQSIDELYREICEIRGEAA